MRTQCTAFNLLNSSNIYPQVIQMKETGHSIHCCPLCVPNVQILSTDHHSSASRWSAFVRSDAKNHWSSISESTYLLWGFPTPAQSHLSTADCHCRWHHTHQTGPRDGSLSINHTLLPSYEDADVLPWISTQAGAIDG